MKKITIVELAIISSIGFIGCAHPPPKELEDARQAYQRAAAGPANEFTPADVHKAKEALDTAEQAYHNDANAQSTKDLAYVAQRKAELAEVLALQAQDQRDQAQAEKTFQTKQAALVASTTTELARTKEQLDQEKAALAESQDKNKMLQDNLAKLAAVKTEDRGVVLTLNGSVLFPSDQSSLLPEAQTRLDQIAQALMTESSDHKLLIEGYTDSRGPDSHNVELSQARAESVRNYIISRGYPVEKVRAAGYGKARPIASNSSAEGRANNRRVEIVVQPDKSAQ